MITILGIRHHGVGSAKNVLARLEQLRPDLILVEGPPELDAITKWVGSKELKPPVAMLCYDEAHPKRSVFYPFSEFSPEWQAIRFANKHKIPVRMMDLPMALRWEMTHLDQAEAPLADIEQPNPAEVGEATPSPEDSQSVPPVSPGDPIAYFAAIAGYTDSDLWWEHTFEQGQDLSAPADHFEAVQLMMQNLREAGVESSLDKENIIREAWMARMLRQAQNEMYQNIAVVCGAWHVPALLDLDKSEKEHAKVLKQLPKTKIKVGATWVPWTNDRLSYQSGYGAGIHSPGWYYHLWKHPEDMGQRWLTRVAQIFRAKNMDISTAHVIEAFRLAESLAGLRGLSRPGVLEMNEATATVMCMGDVILLDLVRQELIVGNALGKVPESLPKLPLQADFEEQTRKLRLPQTALEKELKLDLRTELDLKRSVFFFRLHILDIPWAKLSSQRGKGTFREVWEMRWEPEMTVAVIERGIWGNTLEDAATKFLLDKAARATSIGELSALISVAIPAELYEAIEAILGRINRAAAVSADIAELMGALLPLADLGRYGNVRKSDIAAIHRLIEGLATRIYIGLPNACYGLDEESAQKMFELIRRVNDALRTLENHTLIEDWLRALTVISSKDGIPPVLGGCTCRLLFDAQVFDREETARRFAFALSAGQDAADAAGWLEGFLKGSGMLLLYDDVLWNLLYKWVADIHPESFNALLPILRRTFSKFSTGERRSLGEKAKQGSVIGAENAINATENQSFDLELGEMALELATKFLITQSLNHSITQ
ncbi:MAG: DUF5682 family protein [Thermoanaerobaculia bacterium]|nr:DUF5682 family protein [Thermoanaerobaculia bacterium]